MSCQWCPGSSGPPWLFTLHRPKTWDTMDNTTVMVTTPVSMTVTCHAPTSKFSLITTPPLLPISRLVCGHCGEQRSNGFFIKYIIASQKKRSGSVHLMWFSVTFSYFHQLQKVAMHTVFFSLLEHSMWLDKPSNAGDLHHWKEVQDLTKCIY